MSWTDTRPGPDKNNPEKRAPDFSGYFLSRTGQVSVRDKKYPEKSRGVTREKTAREAEKEEKKYEKEHQKTPETIQKQPRVI